MNEVDLDLNDLNAWLLGFLNFESEPNWELLKLATMEKLCEKFGHPERSCPCFHVAGSKGKGTIAANIAQILRVAGYKTGVYGSPHVLHYTERVGTGEDPFAMEVYDQAFAELKSGVEELLLDGELKHDDVSWFELSTMFAMLCFRIAEVDYAIYEVGLGGRLDATNVVVPECCAFGAIELEHTEFLGNTLTAVASEKAGILKPGVPAVSIAQKPEVEEVLQKRAEELGVKIEFLPRMDNYERADANVAVAAVKCILPDLDVELADEAIKHTRLPGRFELLGDEDLPNKFKQIPYVLLDVAHTPNSIKCVTERMQRENLHGKLLFGCVKDKCVEEMAQILAQSGLFSEVYLTRPGDFKQSDLAVMQEVFDEAFGQAFVLGDAGTEIKVDEEFGRMIDLVVHEAVEQEEPVIVLGSFYLVAEVKKYLLKQGRGDER